MPKLYTVSLNTDDWFTVVAKNKSHATSIVHQTHYGDMTATEFKSEFSPTVEPIPPRRRIGCQGDGHPWKVKTAEKWAESVPVGPFISNTYED